MFEAGSAQGFPLRSGEEDNEDVPMSEEKCGDDEDDADDEDDDSDDDEADDDGDGEDDDDDGQGSDGDIEMKEVRRSNRTSDDTTDSLSDFTYDNYERKMIAKRLQVHY